MRYLAMLCGILWITTLGWGQAVDYSGVPNPTPMIGQPVPTPSLVLPRATPMAGPGLATIGLAQPIAPPSMSLQPEGGAQSGASNGTADNVAGASSAMLSLGPEPESVNLLPIYYGDPLLVVPTETLNWLPAETPGSPGFLRLGAAVFDQGYSIGEPAAGRSLAAMAAANRAGVGKAPKIYTNADLGK